MKIHITHRRTKYDIEDLHSHAETKNGKCLSVAYTHSEDKYDWECSYGHQWSARWGHVRRGTWCPTCHAFKLREYKHRIEDLHKHAKKKGGICHDDKYRGLHSKYQWECGICAHKWRATWHLVNSHGTWCPSCFKMRKTHEKNTLKDLHDHAQAQSGSCHSDEYTGVMGYYEWECEHGHRWSAQWHSVKSMKTWCPVCAIDSMRSSKIA